MKIGKLSFGCLFLIAVVGSSYAVNCTDDVEVCKGENTCLRCECVNSKGSPGSVSHQRGESACRSFCKAHGQTMSKFYCGGLINSRCCF